MSYTKNSTRQKRKSAAPKRSVYEIVTETIIARLEEGTAPWRMPWTMGGLPLRMNANTPYRGINVLLLGVTAQAKGYRSPWWGTYDHIAERAGMTKVPDGSPRGYHWESEDGSPRGVRKDEKSTLVTFWTRTKWAEQNADGDDEEHHGQMLRYTRAFNAEQADGLPERFYATEDPGAQLSPVDSAEALMRRYLDNGGPAFRVGGNQASYSPFLDEVNVPPLASYTDVNEYYSTAYHELTHSTGHEKRLHRDGMGECLFGSPDYAREELVAELGCAYLCAIAGTATPEVTGNSAAYLAGWIKSLKGDSHLIVVAAARAQHAADLILGTTFTAEDSEPVSERTTVAA